MEEQLLRLQSTQVRSLGGASKTITGFSIRRRSRAPSSIGRVAALQQSGDERRGESLGKGLRHGVDTSEI